MSAVRTDVAARAARERAEGCSCEGCALHAELYRAGYVLFPLAEPGAVAARPVRLKSKYEGSCAACSAPIAVGDTIWWTRGVQGIECAECGGES